MNREFENFIARLKLMEFFETKIGIQAHQKILIFCNT